MSRLRRRRRKQYRVKIFLYTIILIVTIVLLVIFGLKTLVKGSLYLNNLFRKTAEEEIVVEKEEFFGRLTVYDIPEATNSAEIIVSGVATEFDAVEFYLNESMVTQIDTSDDSSFSEEIGKLQAGTNSIYVSAKSTDTDVEKLSDTFFVSYLTEKPSLSITNPENDTATTDNCFARRGVKDTGALSPKRKHRSSKGDGRDHGEKEHAE